MSRMTGVALLLSITLLGNGAAAARLPFADPCVIAEKGVYYAYGTTSGNDGVHGATSTNLVDWTLLPEPVLRKGDGVYGTDHFWAPEVHKVGGRYLLLYTSSEGEAPGYNGICVAESDSPRGPFRSRTGRPLIAESAIDNTLFVDGDGSARMFFVRYLDAPGIWSAPFDLATLTLNLAKARRVVTATESWEIPTDPKFPWRVCEAPYVVKENGLYHLIYSTHPTERQEYNVCLATAPSIDGPWTKRGGRPVLASRDGLFGPGHGAFFKDFAGHWKFAFHAHHSSTQVSPREMYTADASFISAADGSPWVEIGRAVSATSLPVAKLLEISDDYRMTVDGAAVEVYCVPTPEPSGGGIEDKSQWHPYSYAPFVATGAVEVCVKSESPIVPFVVPTDRPTAEEVDGIVTTLRTHGFSQFLIYPGDGLGYDYLGEDYFGMVGEFLDGAKRRGMKVWLYDEFNWPSGTAHGRVPTELESCLYRELVATTNAEGVVSWQIVVSRGLNVDNYCYDGNNLEPAGVARFMELTHRAYEHRFRDYLGTTVPGIFTDEPGHWSSAWRLQMPKGTWLRLPYWSGMEEEYARASGGRDFRADCEKALREGKLQETDIFRIWTEIRGVRYRKTYFDSITAWCKTNGLVSTGHLFSEGWPADCARINGLPLHVLKGLAKPGVDLITSSTDRNYEWLTLAFGQSAAMRAGRPGSVELFGLGPCDISFATMRKMFWISALHRLDTYFVALYHTRGYRFLKKDSWAMFTSPDQPWFDEMPLLHETATLAAKWAQKPFRCDIALVYPQRQSGSAGCVGGCRPALHDVCRDLTWNGYTYDLIEEDETTDKPIVLAWDGEQLIERRSGARIGASTNVVTWIARRTGQSPSPGHLRRAYQDGTWADVDLTTGEVKLSTDPDRATCGEATPLADTWNLSLSGPSRRRLWFWRSKSGPQAVMPWEKGKKDSPVTEQREQADNTAVFTVDAPLKDVRFVLRDYPRGQFSLTLDGRPLAFTRSPAVSLVPTFNGICRETEPMRLAAGRHVIALQGGIDSKLFLPVAWIIGDFVERVHGRLSPVPPALSPGSLFSVGLTSFAGTVTYSQTVAFSRGECLRVDSGGAVVRVRYGGRDLGVRGWPPFEWTIPDDLAGRELPLEISVKTSVRPIFGSEKSPDAKLDHALWVPSAAADPSPVGLLGCWRVHR